MRKIVAGILLLTAFTSCFEPQRNCIDFKTGTFEFQSYLNGELVTSRFERSDGLEIDYFKGNTDTSSVRWINNCEYIISNLNPKNRAEEKPIHIKILTTKDNSYTFEYSLVGESEKQRGTVVKVE